MQNEQNTDNRPSLMPAVISGTKVTVVTAVCLQAGMSYAAGGGLGLPPMAAAIVTASIAAIALGSGIIAGVAKHVIYTKEFEEKLYLKGIAPSQPKLSSRIANTPALERGMHPDLEKTLSGSAVGKLGRENKLALIGR